MPHEGFELYGSLVSLNWTIVIQLINTIIIFFILRHFLLTPVHNLIVKRQAAINDAFADAELKKLNANTLIAEYEGKMENLAVESREIVKAAKLKADGQAADIIEEAKEKAAEMIKRAEEQIEKDKQKAINELRDQISGIALFAAEKIIEKELNQTSHNEMIDKLIEEAGNSQWQN